MKFSSKYLYQHVENNFFLETRAKLIVDCRNLFCIFINKIVNTFNLTFPLRRKFKLVLPNQRIQDILYSISEQSVTCFISKDDWCSNALQTFYYNNLKFLNLSIGIFKNCLDKFYSEKIMEYKLRIRISLDLLTAS